MKRPTKNFSKPSTAKQNQLLRLRQQIAVESARLMSEEGIDSFNYARKKAAHKLGIHNEHAYPDNKEILAQLKIHQSLYLSSSHEQTVHDLRKTALNAMKLFQDFSPKLIGSVLLGHANKHSSIDILLIANSPEEIAMHLLKHNIPYQLQDWKLFFNKKKHQRVPSYQFYAHEHKVNLIILTENQRKLIPLSTLNGQSMQRASIKQLEALLL